MKKHVLKLFFLIVLILTVFALGGCREQQPQAAEQEIQLYWNVEGSLYRGDPDELAPRTPNADGTYTVNFAANGEQQRLTVSQQVIDKGLDMLDVVGLVFDENGTVTDFKTVEECTGGYAVKHYFVQSVEGNTVVCDSSPCYDGYEKTVTVTESTRICRVGGTDILVGTYTTIQPDDEITAICDTQGNVTHVFVEPLRSIPDIYWNIERKYSSTSKSTTRESNALGIYEFTFAVNGQIVTLQTRDRNTASKVDAIAAKCMALTFDEDGYIDTVTTAYNACGGSFGSWYHITDLTEDRIFAHKYSSGSDQGSSGSAFIARNFIAYDVSSTENMGQPTELRIGDQVHCLVNTRGQVVIAYVVGRMVDGGLYWNVERKYDSSTKQTTRLPDSEGWYHILLATDGKQVTLKTKDKSIVNAMDGRNDKHFTLQVDGDVITAFYKPSASTGGSYFASWSHVTEITDNGVVTAVKKETGVSETAKMAEDCRIYNVSSLYFSHIGEETDLRVGDQIHGETNLAGELVVIYVVSGRLSRSPMYWNIDRKWSSTAGETTRVPDEDGYYSLTLAVNGEQVTVRTNNRDFVNTMDKSAAAAFGLSLDGDVVKKIYTASQVTGGSGWSSWCDVMEVRDDGTVVTKRVISGDNQGKTYTATMDWDCKIYDVSSSYISHKGEKATLQAGDRIQGYLNKNGEIEYIYIVSRDPSAVAPDHFHCPCLDACGEDTGWTVWTNPRTLPTDGNWYLATDITLQEAVTISAGSSLGLCLNGYTINGQSTGTLSMFRVNGSLTITDCAPQEQWGSIISNTEAYGSVIYQFDSTATTVNLYAGHLRSSLTSQSRNGGIVYIGDKGTQAATFNMYGGTITGLTVTSGRGGAVKISQGHSFNMYGGTITGGSAPSGGNIDLASGTLKLCGGTVSGGTATDKGGNIYVASGTLTIDGCTVENGSAVNYGGNIDFVKGTLNFKSGIVQNGNAKNAGGIRLQKDGTMNMYDGAVLSGSYATSESGNLQINTGATFNMYGGQIADGGRNAGTAVTARGGNVNIYGTMNMYGGTVSSGASTDKGGNISGYGSFVLNISTHPNSTSVPTISDGSIVLRGTAPQLNMSCGVISDRIYLQAGTVHVEGSARIRDLYLEGGAMTAGTLESTAFIGISMKTPGVFLTNASEAMLPLFESTDSSYAVILEAGSLKLERNENG